MANPQYIIPIVASIQAIVMNYSPALLEGTGYGPFIDSNLTYTGVIGNPPAVWTMPTKTMVDDDGTTQKERHSITVKFAVTASEPDDLTNAAMAYMVAISNAIDSAQIADWQGGIIPLRVLVYEHDYGPLFERDGKLARFPEAHVLVEVEEMPVS